MPAPALAKLALHLYPIGPLADQIDAYWAARSPAATEPARDPAPHCALTHLFTDAPPTVAHYIDVLQATVEAAWDARPSPIVRVQSLRLEGPTHSLILASPWLHTVAATFAAQAATPTRDAPIHLVDPLRLDLATDIPTDIPADQQAQMADLAQRHIDPAAPVHWELRLVEQEANGEWATHFARALDLPHDRHPAG